MRCKKAMFVMLCFGYIPNAFAINVVCEPPAEIPSFPYTTQCETVQQIPPGAESAVVAIQGQMIGHFNAQNNPNLNHCTADATIFLKAELKRVLPSGTRQLVSEKSWVVSMLWHGTELNPEAEHLGDAFRKFQSFSDPIVLDELFQPGSNYELKVSSTANVSSGNCHTPLETDIEVNQLSASITVE